MAPFDILGTYGKPVGYAVALLIGAGFGAALEMSGFGDSRKLSAQFYFKDMTVLKVMFTAITVAMTLVFLGSSFRLLDFNRIYVSETYLMPGIVGGLVMGVGFIIGGFCPGTSIVSAATLKIDGIMFAAGVAFGTFVFGESLPGFRYFSNTTYLGRFTLPEWLGLPTGMVVLLVVVLAIVMFYGAEIGEKVFGQGSALSEMKLVPAVSEVNRKKMISAFVLMVLAVVTMVNGQPGIDDRWALIEKEEMKKINDRDVFVHPGELLETMNEPMLYKIIMDVRSADDFSRFHLQDANHVTMDSINDGSLVKELGKTPSNNVKFIVSNDEKSATVAYKRLRAQGVINLYILAGGINRWLELFPPGRDVAVPNNATADDVLKFNFSRDTGEMLMQSNPVGDMHYHGKKLVFEKKIKLEMKKKVSGGCG